MPITVRGQLDPVRDDEFSKISSSYQITLEDIEWLLSRSDVEFAARYMMRDSYFRGSLERCETRFQWREVISKARRYLHDIYNLRKPYEGKSAPTCSRS